MRVMVMVRATADSEAGRMPSADLLAAMGAFNQQLIDAGVMVDGGGIKPSSTGLRVRYDGEGRQLTEGPFPTEEIVAGYWIWQVESMEEAVSWARRCPNPMPGPSDIEIRPFYEMEDFADAGAG
ncbi:MAG: YciI family protein [Pikeienuella sp.]